MSTLFLIRNGNPDTMLNHLFMAVPTFRALVTDLVDRNLLQWDPTTLSIEESLANFLYICGKISIKRKAADRFQHSTDTIQRYFSQMRLGLVNLAPFIIRPPKLNILPLLKWSTRADTTHHLRFTHFNLIYKKLLPLILH